MRDVNFEVKQGEVVGIIGRNGAGKSTLLKILSRITEPTEGRVRIRGRVASLLEVGTGFHPELTGRENIFVNGAILGMTRAEIAKKFDEIVAFAEIEKFLDTPVKRYSSGMYVRLAFAVAAHLEPEILIVDEVLAVGDAEFQKKCLGKIKDVAGHGRTVLFVSHNMQAINTLCSRAILMTKGVCELQGLTSDVVRNYLAYNAASANLETTFSCIDPDINLLKIKISQFGVINSEFVTSKETFVQLTIVANGVSDSEFICGFTIFDENGGPVLSTYFNEFADALPKKPVKGSFRLVCSIPANFLNEGKFGAVVDVGIAKVRRVTTDDQHCFTMQFSNPDGLGARFGLGRGWRRGPVLPLLKWRIDENT